MEIKIGKRLIGLKHPTYFIADVAANHDGDLERARMLIRLAKEAGADAAKFQNFDAPKIVSDYGFRSMQGQVSHQAKWKKSVSEVYAGASIPFEWTPELKMACDEAGIDYFDEIDAEGSPISISDTEAEPLIFGNDDDILANIDASDAIGLYLKEATRVPLLNVQEELELAQRIERGKMAREEMVKGNITARRQHELRRLVDDG